MGQTVEARFILRDEFSAGLDQIKGGMKDLSKVGGLGGSALSVLGGAASVYGVVRLGEQLVKFAQDGAQVKRVGEYFDLTARGVNQSGGLMMASLRDLTKNTVDDQSLMTMGSELMLNGLTADMGKLQQLYSITGSRAKALGRDTQEAFMNVAHGIAAGELGPMIDLGFSREQLQGSVDAYAAGLGKTAVQMNAAEKAQASLNAVLELGKGQLMAAGNQALDDADKYAQAAAAIKNFKDAWAMKTSGPLAGIAMEATDILRGDKTSWAIRESEKRVAYLEDQLRKTQGPANDLQGILVKLGLEPDATGLQKMLDEARIKLALLSYDAQQTAFQLGGIGTIAGMLALRTTPAPAATAPAALSDATMDNQVRYLAGKGVDVYWADKRKKDAEEAVRAGEEAGRRWMTAYNQGLQEQRGRIEGILFTPSGVTAGDMFTAKTGGATPLHADETIRRLRAAILNGSKEWQGLVPAEVRGMNSEMQRMWLQAQEERFYAAGSPETVNWEGFRQQYGAAMQRETDKASLVQRAMQELGPGADKGMAKQLLGISDMGDMGAQMATGFQDAVNGINPAQMLASRFTADLATNKKALQDASKSAWNTIIGSIGLADESPLDALASRVAPKVAAINSWNNGATGSGAKP